MDKNNIYTSHLENLNTKKRAKNSLYTLQNENIQLMGWIFVMEINEPVKIYLKKLL